MNKLALTKNQSNKKLKENDKKFWRESLSNLKFKKFVVYRRARSILSTEMITLRVKICDEHYKIKK